ncbi:PP2C family serine/threonine-protein phosphatase [Pedococcus sp. KACC 23699]|uniref:PP2C family serine/threonine-protein phosphatase n=1 Tax=Pedococcus sp. KACC 23699 TaxID=3149228 RepID=A0AAU7JX47_9MICO
MDVEMMRAQEDGAVSAVEEPVGDPLICPSCTSAVATGERYCEACGADLGLPPAPEPAPAPEPTAAAPVASGPEVPVPEVPATESPLPTTSEAAPRQACHECGGEVADDGYCTQCGAAAANPRNHFTELPAPWVAAVCDRGVRHTRNEDAVALAAGPGPGGHAVLVVCDGVSSSTDSDVASLAAARAARDVLDASAPRATGSVASWVAASTRALVAAADAANEAVIANTTAGPGNPASCTFVAAALDGAELTVGWVGDSRAYWLPDTGTSRLLTVDDSYAAEQIALGVPRADAESGPQAHAITRWLGIDAPDHTPRTVSLRLDVPGWLLVCSDGLWNYCSEAHDLASLVAATAARGTSPDEPLRQAEPLRLAGALVDWANAQGGQDNITVALARVEARPPDSTAHSVAAPARQSEPHREEVQPDGHIHS